MTSDEHGRCRHGSISSARQIFQFKSDTLHISVNDLQISCQRTYHLTAKYVCHIRINGGRPPQGYTTSPLSIGGPPWKLCHTGRYPCRGYGSQPSGIGAYGAQVGQPFGSSQFLTRRRISIGLVWVASFKKWCLLLSFSFVVHKIYKYLLCELLS